MTDRRVVIQDNSFVGKKTALTSVPYTRVNAVSFVSDKSVFGKFASSSTIALSAGGQIYEVSVPRRREGEARPQRGAGPHVERRMSERSVMADK